MTGRERCPRCGFVACIGWLHDPDRIGCYKCGWAWKQVAGSQQELFYENDLSYIGDRFERDSIERKEQL
jgi:ribosomal protein S27AE